MALEGDIRKFTELLAKHEARLERLERGNSADQLAHSSIEDAGLNAYDSDGTLRQRLGKQLDGTFAITYSNGPAPPPPTQAETVSRELGIVISWQGMLLDVDSEEIEPPADFSHVDIHMSEQDGFHPDPATTLVASLATAGSVFIGADLNPKYVLLLAVSTSRSASIPSQQATAQAAPASNLAVTNTLVIGENGRLVAGNPDADRLQFSAEGLQQFDDDGDLTVQIGNNPAAGNTLTVRGTPHETRRNLSTNPKLDNNTADWSGGRASITREDGYYVGTDWCLRLVGNGNDQPYVGMQQHGLGGATLAAQVTVYASVACTITFQADGLDPLNNYVPPVLFETYDFAAGETRRMSGVATTTDDMVMTQPHVVMNKAAVPATEFIDVSLLCLERGYSVVLPYFDGDTVRTWPDGEVTEGDWSAEAGNSMSSLVMPPTHTRRNLSTNPKLDNNTDGWGSLRVSSAGRVDGANVSAEWCYQVVTSGERNPAIQTNYLESMPLTTYVFVVSVYSSTELPMKLEFDQYNSTDDFIGAQFGPVETIPANTVTELNATITTIGSVAVIIPFVFVEDAAPPAGVTIQVSKCLVEETNRYEGYFDGDSPNATWTGTAGNSTSVLIDVGVFRDQTLTSMSDQGTLAVQSLATTDLSVGGRDLADLLAPKARGVLAYSGYVFAGGSQHTTGTMGWYEIAFTCPPGRLINLTANAWVRAGGDVLYGVAMQVRFTTDGTRPTVSSPELFSVETHDNGVCSYTTTVTFPDNAWVRLLMCAHTWTGQEVWLTGPSSLIAEDGGPQIAPAYVLNDGGGSGVPPPAPPPPPRQHYNIHWRAIWGQTWNQHGFRVNGECIQGFYPDGWNGDNKAIFGFDWANIQATLAGATITDIAVYLYFHHWYYNSGGIAVLGYSNKSSGGGGYEIADFGIAEYHIGKGAGQWCGLPNWLGDGFRDGWAKTINLDSAFKGHDLIFYGAANWDAILGIQFDK